MDLSLYIADAERESRRTKILADAAMNQITDDQFFTPICDGTNSVAVIVKHVAGNLRSRWRDFLATDGEKPDRDRDSEFLLDSADTRESLHAAWENGWRHLFTTLQSLKPEDLRSTVRIRGEPHVVYQAINRQISHTASHVGQIILIARGHAADSWSTLSIPKDQSAIANRSVGSYLVDPMPPRPEA